MPFTPYSPTASATSAMPASSGFTPYNSSVTTSPKKGIFSRLSNTGDRSMAFINKEFKRGGESLLETGRQYASGRITPAEVKLQVAGTVAHGINDVLGGAAVGAINPVLPAIEALNPTLTTAVKGLAGSKPVHDVAAGYRSWAESNPVAAKDLESLVDVTTLLPAGEGLGEVKNATGALLSGTGDVLAGTGRVAEEVAKRGYQASLPVSTVEAGRILNYEAKTPFLTRVVNTAKNTPAESKPLTVGATAADKGVMGTEKMVGVQAKRIGSKLWENRILPAVKSSLATISKNDLFEPIVERIAKTAEPGRKQALQDAFEAIQEDYKNIDKLSLEEAQDIKRGLDEFTPDKIFKGKSVANEYATLKNDMANAIRKKTYDALDNVNIKKDYLDYGNLEQLQQVGINAITASKLQGGAGKFLHGLWDKLITPVSTLGNQAVYRVGNSLEFVGDKGLKTFGEYLQQQGFHKK